MPSHEIEPAGTYRPQYHLRWRGLVRLLDRFPRAKGYLADLVRRALTKVFDPGVITTERVVEYPFVYQNLAGLTGPILDIGCVHSRLPIALASRGCRMVGLDFLPYPHRHPNLQAVRRDATGAPFRGASFDAVVAVSVIEHIGIGHYGDPSAEGADRETVREIARILKPGGRCVITLPFGRPLTDDSKRVYDSPHLQRLLAPLRLLHIEYAWSRGGLWTPCTEAEAATVDWNGPNRAVVLVVATGREEPLA
jgi:SAM-dependent methyltransferase